MTSYNMYIDWDWFDSEDNHKTTYLDVTLHYYKGVYYGPYENSYPDEYDITYNEVIGPEMPEDEYTKFEQWAFEHADFDDDGTDY